MEELTASGDIAVVDSAGRHAEVFDTGRRHLVARDV